MSSDIAGSHQAFDAQKYYDFHCAAKMKSFLLRYLEDLGRIIFLRDSSRSFKYWLLIFYSLCIQSIVSSVLNGHTGIALQPAIEAGMHDTSDQREESDGFRQIIYLFFASSRNFDPLSGMDLKSTELYNSWMDEHISVTRAALH